MLIHLYGELWNPDAVTWGGKGAGNKGKLLGTVLVESGDKRDVDLWEGRGIYGLYDNFRLVYVGQALDQPLGKRLRDHLTDRHAGRWDMFSWYSTSTLREKNVRKPGARQVEPKTVIQTLESLAIALTNPPLNRRYDQLPGARQVEQKKSTHPHTVRHYLEKIIAHHKIKL